MPTVGQYYAHRAEGSRRLAAGRSGATAAAMTGASGGSGAAASAAPVVLMVSGGADSTALALMACTSTLDIADGRGQARIARERLHVLHVNHHLRGAASDADEAFVRDLCARLGLPLCVEHAQLQDLGGKNLEGAAREVRYAAARRYVARLSREMGTPRSQARILTAHTATDRAETFFMNAIKGSGPAGLSSIPRRRNIIVRPLLDMTHEELVYYLQVRGQGWCEDATNQDTSYLRNYVRHKLMPIARERNGNLERTISVSCDIVGDEDAFMTQLAATALRTCVRREADGLLLLDGQRLAAAEVAIARRVVRLAVKRVDPEVRLEMQHVERVLACVAAGDGSCTLPGAIDVRMEFGMLALSTASAREELVAGWLTVAHPMALANGQLLSAELVEVPRGEDPVSFARSLGAGRAAAMSGAAASAVLAVPQGAPAPVPSAQVACVDAVALGYDPRDLVPSETAEQRPDRMRLWVDSPAPGDTMCPLGMAGRSKKLSDLLGEAKIPLADRPRTPVVRTAPGGAVVWVAGVRMDERFRCTAATRVIVRLVMRPAGTA